MSRSAAGAPAESRSESENGLGVRGPAGVASEPSVLAALMTRPVIQPAMRRRAARYAALLALLAVVAGCGSAPEAPTPRIPPPAAPPGVVLHAYLDSLLVGDCATARLLATSTFRKGNGELCGALSLSAYRVNPEPATPNANEAVYGTTLTTSGSSDGTVSPGETTWFYDLARQPDGSWRLVGGGSGP